MPVSPNKISVLVLTYNHELYIRQCFESILNQEVDLPFEIVVSDDASSDGTLKILEEYQSLHQNIRILTAEKNLGLMKNYQKCLNACDGLYLATVAGDDYWIDERKLQKQLEFILKNPDYSLVHTDDSVLYENTGQIIPSRHGTWASAIPSGDIFSHLLVDNFIGALTIFTYTKVLKSSAESIHLFESGWLMEDYPLWLEIAGNYKIGYLPDITAMHRFIEQSISNPFDRRKNYQLMKSSYDIKFYFLSRYTDKVTQDLKIQIEHNYASFIYERSFLLNDKQLLSDIGTIHYKPASGKQWLYYYAAGNPFFKMLLRSVMGFKHRKTNALYH